MTERTLTVKEVAERYGVGTHTVGAWIRNGELRALQVGRSLTKKRVTWRVTESALADFELLRSSSPPSTVTTRRRRKHETPRYY